MTRYSNRNGDSGVRSYEVGPDYIRVQFSSGSPYLYNYSSAGESNIEEMKRLAKRGFGLNGFIYSNVKNKYVR